MSPLFLLNPSSSSLALAINEESVGSLGPCEAGYVPSSTWFEITKYEEPRKPHLGLNELGVAFKEEPRVSYVFPFVLPPGFRPQEEDAVAVVTRGWLVLTMFNGQPLRPNSLPIPGVALPRNDQHDPPQEEP